MLATLLTTRKAAEYLGLSYGQLYRQMQHGALKPVVRSVGSNPHLFRQEDLDQWQLLTAGLLTTREAAEYVGLKYNYLIVLVGKNQGPPIKQRGRGGKPHRFDLQDLDRWNSQRLADMVQRRAQRNYSSLCTMWERYSSELPTDYQEFQNLERLTVKQAAQYLQLPVCTLYRMHQKGIGPACQRPPGAGWVEYNRKELDTWIDQQGGGPTKESLDTPEPVLTPEDHLQRLQLQQTVQHVLATFTPREEQVVYGWMNEQTLQAMGKELSVTRERARQILSKAITKLQHPARTRHFAVFRQKGEPVTILEPPAPVHSTPTAQEIQFVLGWMNREKRVTDLRLRVAQAEQKTPKPLKSGRWKQPAPVDLLTSEEASIYLNHTFSHIGCLRSQGKAPPHQYRADLQRKYWYRREDLDRWARQKQYSSPTSTTETNKPTPTDRQIATSSGKVEPGFVVPNQTPDEAALAYVVDLVKGTCTCPDYKLRHLRCQHQEAAWFWVAWGETPVNVKHIKIEESVYTQAQTTEKTRITLLLKSLCCGIDEPPRKPGPGRPALLFRDKVFAVVMKVYTGMSGRGAMTDIQDCAERGHIAKPVHYSSVFRTLESTKTTDILVRLVEESAAPLAEIENAAGQDSTGFSTVTYDRWFDQKHGKLKARHSWVKLRIMVGTTTNVVTSAKVRDGGDCLVPPKLTETAQNFEAVIAGSFKSDSVGASCSPRWRKMWARFSFRSEDFLQRNVETTVWMIKSKFGSSVRSKSQTAQINEVLCKVISHNLCCIVHAVTEFGIESELPLPAAAELSRVTR